MNDSRVKEPCPVCHVRRHVVCDEGNRWLVVRHDCKGKPCKGSRKVVRW